jgi:non-hemolytic enterotoxin B/C
MFTTTSSAQGIDSANKAQSGQALLIQTYSNSVLEQPAVDFSGEAHLEQYQTQINTGLTTAQTHATTYLNLIQPGIITNISNIGNYYAIHNAVATTFPAGSTKAAWVERLTALQTESDTYQTEANDLVIALMTLHRNLTKDVASFAATVNELNTAISGDNGILASDDKELSWIQGEIDGAIAGIVLSGLAISGGAFMMVVGSVADFVTAGTTTPLIVGGIGIVAGGVSGDVESAIVLKKLNDSKVKLLTEESTLKAEVKLALGIKSGYQSLFDQVGKAVEAATEMKNAWEFLSSDLRNMISDLNNDAKSAEQISTIFLTAAEIEVYKVIADIAIIQGQMVGAQTSTSGQTLNTGISQAQATLQAA